MSSPVGGTNISACPSRIRPLHLRDQRPLLHHLDPAPQLVGVVRRLPLPDAERCDGVPLQVLVRLADAEFVENPGLLAANHAVLGSHVRLSSLPRGGYRDRVPLFRHLDEFFGPPDHGQAPSGGRSRTR
ncbi:MAG: hypothetical protein QMD46_08765 [Methanomicrobiales archaeon]|nr:hypothetical protein [Methanomicrobiales archaeon]